MGGGWRKSWWGAHTTIYLNNREQHAVISSSSYTVAVRLVFYSGLPYMTAFRGRKSPSCRRLLASKVGGARRMLQESKVSSFL